jgi:hypothetical protein
MRRTVLALARARHRSFSLLVYVTLKSMLKYARRPQVDNKILMKRG